MKTLLITLALFGFQQHSHKEDAAKSITITGQVVELACFMGHNTSGPKHTQCAESCARAGNPLAIYDGKQLYLPIALDHKNPNTKLMTFIEKRVKVTGKALDRANLKGIAIDKVESAE